MSVVVAHVADAQKAFASEGSRQIDGNISINTGGSAVRYGSTRQLVLSLALRLGILSNHVIAVQAVSRIELSPRYCLPAGA